MGGAFGYVKNGRDVSLCGSRGSPGADPICVLPLDHRPATDLHFTRSSSVGPVGVTVTADGLVLVSGVTDWTSFDGITFQAADA